MFVKPVVHCTFRVNLYCRCVGLHRVNELSMAYSLRHQCSSHLAFELYVLFNLIELPNHRLVGWLPKVELDIK